MKTKRSKAEESVRSYVQTLACLEASGAVSARYDAKVNYEWNFHYGHAPLTQPDLTLGTTNFLALIAIMWLSNFMLNQSILQGNEDYLLFQETTWAQAELTSTHERKHSGSHRDSNKDARRSISN